MPVTDAESYDLMSASPGGNRRQAAMRLQQAESWAGSEPWIRLREAEVDRYLGIVVYAHIHALVSEPTKPHGAQKAEKS